MSTPQQQEGEVEQEVPLSDARAGDIVRYQHPTIPPICRSGATIIEVHTNGDLLVQHGNIQEIVHPHQVKWIVCPLENKKGR